MSKVLDYTGLTYYNGKIKGYVDNGLNGKVNIETGKGLSTNDLTNELKSNYDAAYAHLSAAHAPASAETNIIEVVKVNGTALTVTDKAVNVTVPTTVAALSDAGNYALKSEIPSVPTIEAITNTEIDAIFAS